MCEGEAGVGGAESGKGPELVWVEEASGFGNGVSLTVITRSRIFEMVLRRTIMRNEAGES